jgi:hypothetical protein
MKELVKTGSDKFKKSLFQKGVMNNPNINTPEFYKKFTGDCKTFSEYSSKILNRSKKARISRILTGSKKWSQVHWEIFSKMTGYDSLSREHLETLEDDKIEILFKRAHGIQSIINSQKITEMRPSFFIRELINGLNYNRNGLSCIQTRSHTESNFIRLFEKESVWWSYETVILINKDKSGTYTPDFLVYINDQGFIIEVKGSWFNTNKEWYFENKISSLIDYANANNLIPILTFIQEPKNLDFLQKDRLC